MLQRVRAKLRGYKTLAWNTLIGGSAGVGLMLQEMKDIDLTPWFGQYAPKILVGIAIVGIVLRLTSNGPAGGRRARRREQEPAGYETLDDEDDGTRRNSTGTRKARRQSRSNT